MIESYHPPRTAEAQWLRWAGLTYRQIAAVQGCGLTTVQRRANPDYAQRCRESSLAYKKRLHGTCRECGKKTPYHGGNKRVSDLCQACAARLAHERRYWTPERIIERIQLWAYLHGQPPAAQEWLRPAWRTGHRRLWPSVAACQREFGSWSKALGAAGFVARERNPHHYRDEASRSQLSHSPEASRKRRETYKRNKLAKAISQGAYD